MAANIRYARNGDVRLAYRVASDGEPDILVTFGWVGSMESPWWDDPANARWMERLFSLGRVILWDKRGTGLSDRVAPDDLPTLEERMDDLRAVMDAAGSERAVLLGMSEGTVLSSLFAATYPERTEALALYGGAPRWVEGEDYPYAPSAEEAQRFAREICDAWGDNAWLLKLWAPSIADEPGAHARWNEMLVHGASPAAAEAWLRMTYATDIRAALPAIDVPTVVLHRVDDGILPVANGRELGRGIRGARFVELPGADHLWWAGPTGGQDILDEVESLLGRAPAAREPERVLATVMFTDIVDSTRKAAELGDSRWRDLVATHDRVVRGQLERHRGKEVKTLGDGFLATFDGPGRAIRCARAAQAEVARLGLEMRAGLHTGELEVIDSDIGGIAVNIGSRVGALAGPGEVLVSSTVKDLVAGSGIDFEDHGSHELKGVPGEWRLFAVGSGA